MYLITGLFLKSQNRLNDAAAAELRAAQLARSEYSLSVAAATALQRAKRFYEAEIWYKHVVSLRPNDAMSYANLGGILRINGKYRQANSAYLKALELQPNDASIIMNLYNLKSLIT